MKRLLFSIISVIFAFGLLFADEGKYAQAVFAVKTHDFGIIKEEKGPVSSVYEVENTGNKPLLIVDISVSCGCTSTDYTKRPIAPGKKGKIKVTYSPAGRPGAFKKDIKVRTNGREKRTTLFIEGTVIPMAEPSDK